MKKQIIIILFTFILIIILIKNKENFTEITPGKNIYGIDKNDKCDSGYEKINVKNKKKFICVKEREEGEDGINSMIVKKYHPLRNYNSNTLFYVPSRSKYIGCIKKDNTDQIFKEVNPIKHKTKDQCKNETQGNFYGLSIPEYNDKHYKGEDDYNKRIVENKQVDCYKFGDKKPNLENLLVDKSKCNNFKDTNSEAHGGFGYISLYQKENKEHGLNFNSRPVDRYDFYQIGDIIKLKENMVLWFKNDHQFSAEFDGKKLKKFSKGYTGQKEMILRDYSGNGNHARLQHIGNRGCYILNKPNNYKNRFVNNYENFANKKNDKLEKIIIRKDLEDEYDYIPLFDDDKNSIDKQKNNYEVNKEYQMKLQGIDLVLHNTLLKKNRSSGNEYGFNKYMEDNGIIVSWVNTKAKNQNLHFIFEQNINRFIEPQVNKLGRYLQIDIKNFVSYLKSKNYEVTKFYLRNKNGNNLFYNMKIRTSKGGRDFNDKYSLELTPDKKNVTVEEYRSENIIATFNIKEEIELPIDKDTDVIQIHNSSNLQISYIDFEIKRISGGKKKFRLSEIHNQLEHIEGDYIYYDEKKLNFHVNFIDNEKCVFYFFSRLTTMFRNPKYNTGIYASQTDKIFQWGYKKNLFTTNRIYTYTKKIDESYSHTQLEIYEIKKKNINSNYRDLADQSIIEKIRKIYIIPGKNNRDNFYKRTLVEFKYEKNVNHIERIYRYDEHLKNSQSYKIELEIKNTNPEKQFLLFTEDGKYKIEGSDVKGKNSELCKLKESDIDGGNTCIDHIKYKYSKIFTDLKENGYDNFIRLEDDFAEIGGIKFDGQLKKGEPNNLEDEQIRRSIYFGGRHGGVKCPSGKSYIVADKYEACKSLAVKHGEPENPKNLCQKNSGNTGNYYNFIVCSTNYNGILYETEDLTIPRIWNIANKRRLCPIVEANNEKKKKKLLNSFTLYMNLKLQSKNDFSTPLFSYIGQNKDDKNKNHKVLWSLHAKRPYYIKDTGNKKMDDKKENFGLVYRGLKVKKIRFKKERPTNSHTHFYFNFGLRTFDDKHIDLINGGNVEYMGPFNYFGVDEVDNKSTKKRIDSIVIFYKGKLNYNNFSFKYVYKENGVLKINWFNLRKPDEKDDNMEGKGYNYVIDENSPGKLIFYIKNLKIKINSNKVINYGNLDFDITQILTKNNNLDDKNNHISEFELHFTNDRKQTKNPSDEDYKIVTHKLSNYQFINHYNYYDFNSSDFNKRQIITNLYLGYIPKSSKVKFDVPDYDAYNISKPNNGKNTNIKVISNSINSYENFTQTFLVYPQLHHDNRHYSLKEEFYITPKGRNEYLCLSGGGEIKDINGNIKQGERYSSSTSIKDRHDQHNPHPVHMFKQVPGEGRYYIYWAPFWFRYEGGGEVTQRASNLQWMSNDEKLKYDKKPNIHNIRDKESKSDSIRIYQDIDDNNEYVYFMYFPNCGHSKKFIYKPDNGILQPFQLNDKAEEKSKMKIIAQEKVILRDYNKNTDKSKFHSRRDVNVYKIFKENKKNINNYLFPTKMGESIKNLRDSKPKENPRFPHYPYYENYPEVKNMVFSIGDSYNDGYSPYYIDILLKNPVEAHKVFIQDLSDQGLMVEDVEMEIYADGNETDFPDFKYTLKKKKFQNVPIVSFVPSKFKIPIGRETKVGLNVFNKKVKFFWGSRGNSEGQIEKDSLNQIDFGIKMGTTNKKYLHQNDKGMKGYFQVGGDISSVTKMELKELQLFSNDIYPDDHKEMKSDKKIGYLNYNNSGNKWRKLIENHIWKDILDKENILLESINQPKTVSYFSNGSSEKNKYFMIYSNSNKEYVFKNIKSNRIGLKENKYITDGNVDEFIYYAKPRSFKKDIIKENEDLNIFSEKTDSSIRNELINTLKSHNDLRILRDNIRLKILKINKKLSGTEQIYFYDKLFIKIEYEINYKEYISSWRVYREYQITLNYLLTYDKSNNRFGFKKINAFSDYYNNLPNYDDPEYQDCIFEFHPIPNKYLVSDNIVFSCYGKSKDSKCKNNEENIIGNNYSELKHNNKYLFAKNGKQYFKCEKPCEDSGDWKTSNQKEYDNNNNKNYEFDTNYNKFDNQKTNQDSIDQKIETNANLLLIDNSENDTIKNIDAILLNVNKNADGHTISDSSNRGNFKINGNLNIYSELQDSSLEVAESEGIQDKPQSI